MIHQPRQIEIELLECNCTTNSSLCLLFKVYKPAIGKYFEEGICCQKMKPVQRGSKNQSYSLDHYLVFWCTSFIKQKIINTGPSFNCVGASFFLLASSDRTFAKKVRPLFKKTTTNRSFFLPIGWITHFFKYF